MRPLHRLFIETSLPERLQPLQQLAANTYWLDEEQVAEIFQSVDPEIWSKAGRNPKFFLQLLSKERLIELSKDKGFLKQLDLIWQRNQKYLQKNTDNKPASLVAFFSAEFGINRFLPIYSGGLGVLAGDYLKSSSDLGIPLLGVGLFYRKGYFCQIIDPSGWQIEKYPEYNIEELPLEPVIKSDGNPLYIEVEFPERTIRVAVWLAHVGRTRLYLLDTDCNGNSGEDRAITDCLYGGESEKRIQQEIILGIGGIRALNAMGIYPDICHLNEGHSAFLALERIRLAMQQNNLDFNTARLLMSSSHLFTTHTPVKAGIDLFPPYLMDQYFTGYYQSLGLSRQQFLGLGRIDPNNQQESFNMAVLALHLSDWMNGVSRLHSITARSMWKSCWPDLSQKEIPIGSITNGVHISWIGPKMKALYDRYLGAGWRDNPTNPASWQGIAKIPDKELYQAHQGEKEVLLKFARERYARQLRSWGAGPEEINELYREFKFDVLTIGFARRFAGYKRPNLILHQPERLLKLLTHPTRPIQLIFAGKAHPKDDEGKKIIQEIIGFCRKRDTQFRLIFIEDYDVEVGRRLVAGVDLWLGNPRRPLEACSTSGMKAILNGGLHLSTMDGWWDEAYSAETGWAIKNSTSTLDPVLSDEEEANGLFNILENEIIPLFYNQNTDGISNSWIAKMKRSIQRYAPRFNSHRMVEEYRSKYYLSSPKLFEHLNANHQQYAKELAVWISQVAQEWHRVKIEKVEDDRNSLMNLDGKMHLQAIVYLGDLSPDNINVYAIHGLVDYEGTFINPETIKLNLKRDYGQGKYCYSGELTCNYNGEYGYSIKVVPHREDLINPCLDRFFVLG